jgi:hypothetical protein
MAITPVSSTGGHDSVLSRLKQRFDPLGSTNDSNGFCELIRLRSRADQERTKNIAVERPRFPYICYALANSSLYVLLGMFCLALVTGDST